MEGMVWHEIISGRDCVLVRNPQSEDVAQTDGHSGTRDAVRELEVFLSPYA
jgi:hypothetical protein